MTTPLLVVEDDYVLQISIATMLSHKGYTVYSAHNLAEARLQMVQHAPPLVLLDLGLPDGSGLSMLSEVRQLEAQSLVIVTTGDSSIKTVLDALRQGAFDYLTKPINPELLLKTVERAAVHHNLQSAARELERLRAYEEAMQATARTAAHYISQCLTIIMGEAQMLQEDVQDAEAQTSLERIVAATERAATTLTALRQARHFVTHMPGVDRPILDLDAASRDDLESSEHSES